MRIDHRGAKIAALSIFALVCLGTFILLFQAAGGKLRLSSPYTAKTVVPTAFQLVPNGDVRSAGVKIGSIQDITNRGDNGVVKFEVKKQYAPIYKDARVLVRTKTLVGENYLDIQPGHPSAGKLPDGGTLPLEQSGEAVQLDEVLSSLDTKTREQVRRNLDGLAPGLDGHGQALNETLGGLAETSTRGRIVTEVLRRQRLQVAAILDDTAKVMSAFGDRTQQVRLLARQAKATGEAVASRDKEFASAIKQFQPTLSQARESVNKLASFSGRATPVLSDLKVAAHDLQPLMRNLTPAASSGRDLFLQIPPLAKRFNPLLSQLRNFSPALQKAIGPLDSVLRQANPALEYLSPYAKEFGSFFSNAGSVNEYHDSVGALGRVHAMIGYSSVKGVTNDAERKAIHALLDTGGISMFYDPKYNPYPKPGTVGAPNSESAFREVQAEK